MRDDGTGPVLVSRRVILRPGTEADAPVLHAILSEPSVRRWWREPEPIDIFLATTAQGRGLGTEAVLLLARLLDVLGHHRLTIDPAAGNAGAIACGAPGPGFPEHFS